MFLGFADETPSVSILVTQGEEHLEDERLQRQQRAGIDGHASR
jgi:hypothetical protein